MTEQEFRQKYPHSTDEQVRLYCEAVQAETLGLKPSVEPDIPMPTWLVTKPLITVPAPRRIVPSVAPVTTSRFAAGADPTQSQTGYSTGQFFMRNFSLADAPPSEAAAPPEAEPTDCAAELREILLGHHGFSVSLSPEARQRLAETEDMTEADVLALLVGAPSAREFVDLA